MIKKRNKAIVCAIACITLLNSTTPIYVSAANIKNSIEHETKSNSKKQMIVKVNVLNVRSGASTKYKVIGKLSKGDKVTVIQTLSNSWVKIEYKGKTGYVSNAKDKYLHSISEVDKASAKEVQDKIDTLDKVITFGGASEITEIRNEYDNLNDEAKALVTNLNILEKAESDIKNVLDKIDNVNELINNLPKEITLDDKDKIEETRKAYENLGDANKKGISNDTLSILESSELKLKELEESENTQSGLELIIQKINLLSDNITKDNVAEEKAKIDEIALLIYATYDEDTQTITNMDKLRSTRKKVEAMERDIKEAKRVETVIDELVSVDEITTPLKPDVDYARLRYESLSDNAKTLVATSKVEKLKTLEDKILELLYAIEFSSSSAISVILNLPSDVSELTHLDYDTIHYARFIVNRLSDSEKELVKNIHLLGQAEEEWKIITAEKDIVTSAIDKIPSVEDMTIDHKQLVLEARNAYDSADSRIQNYVLDLNYVVLMKAEIQMKKFERIEANSEAKALMQKIEYLTNKELTLNDKEDVLGLEKDYYKLSLDTRESINFGLIQKLQDRLTKLEASIN